MAPSAGRLLRSAINDNCSQVSICWWLWIYFSCSLNYEILTHIWKFSSQLEEFTEFWRAESVPTAELVPHPLSTVLLSSSIWLPRFLSSLVTPLRILRSRESPQDIYNSPSEVMKSSILSSKPPSPVVVSSHISTELLWWNLEAQNLREESHSTEHHLEALLLQTCDNRDHFIFLYKHLANV